MPQINGTALDRALSQVGPAKQAVHDRAAETAAAVQAPPARPATAPPGVPGISTPAQPGQGVGQGGTTK